VRIVDGEGICGVGIFDVMNTRRVGEVPRRAEPDVLQGFVENKRNLHLDVTRGYLMHLYLLMHRGTDMLCLIHLNYLPAPVLRFDDQIVRLERRVITHPQRGVRLLLWTNIGDLLRLGRRVELNPSFDRGQVPAYKSGIKTTDAPRPGPLEEARIPTVAPLSKRSGRKNPTLPTGVFMKQELHMTSQLQCNQIGLRFNRDWPKVLRISTRLMRYTKEVMEHSPSITHVDRIIDKEVSISKRDGECIKRTRRRLATQNLEGVVQHVFGGIRKLPGDLLEADIQRPYLQVLDPQGDRHQATALRIGATVGAPVFR
jgi:hypothetical protein